MPLSFLEVLFRYVTSPFLEPNIGAKDWNFSTIAFIVGFLMSTKSFPSTDSAKLDTVTSSLKLMEFCKIFLPSSNTSKVDESSSLDTLLFDLVRISCILRSSGKMFLP